MPLSRRERAGAVAVALLMLAATAAARLNPEPGFRSTPLPDRPTTYADGQYRFLRTQPTDPRLPVGWDPCRPVPVVVNFAGAPDRFSRLVRDSVHDLDQASGLRLRYAGAVHHGETSPPVGQVLVRFADGRTEPALGKNAGVAWSDAYVGSNGLTYYLWGHVTLNVHVHDYSEHAKLTVLLHELGHAVGLGHVSSGDELMFPGNYQRASYAHGDLTGLALLGRLPCE